jgi:hypothetical protein
MLPRGRAFFEFAKYASPGKGFLANCKICFPGEGLFSKLQNMLPWGRAFCKLAKRAPWGNFFSKVAEKKTCTESDFYWPWRWFSLAMEVVFIGHGVSFYWQQQPNFD